MRRAATLMVLVLGACSEPAPSAPEDAGGRDALAVDAAILPPTAPAPVDPALPPALACPSGWRAITDADGRQACDPWPATGRRDDCAADEAHFPGEPDCARVGPACASDGWPVVPSGASVIYVDDDAAAGGDGLSRATAMLSIRDAAAVAAPGTVVAVAAGAYDERHVIVPAGVTVQGACTSGTRIHSTASPNLYGIVDLRGDGAGVRDLTIDDAYDYGVLFTGANVTIEGLVISRVRTAGIYGPLGTGSATARSIVVRDMRPRSNTRGHGVLVEGGVSLTLTRCVLDTDRTASLLVDGAGGRLHAEDVAVVDTLVDGDGTGGSGVSITGGATAALARVVIERSHSAGLLATTGASVTAEDLMIGATAPDDGGLGGAGIVVSTRSSLTATRASIDGSTGAGALVDGPGNVLTLTDAVVRGTLAPSTGPFATSGVAIRGGARGTVTRIAISGGVDTGLRVEGARTELTATDVVIERMAEGPVDGIPGGGVGVRSGAHATIARARITGCAESGLFASGVGTTIDARMLSIAETTPIADGTGGMGVVGFDGAALTVVGLAIDRCAQVGILLGSAATLTGSDVAIEDTLTGPDLALGHGVHVQTAGFVDLDRISIAGSHEVGVFGAGRGSELVLRNAWVHDTRPQQDLRTLGGGLWVQGDATLALDDALVEDVYVVGLSAMTGARIVGSRVVVRRVSAAECATSSCAHFAGGFDVSAHFGASMTLTDFALSDAALCGVVIGAAAVDGTETGMDLMRGTVERVPIGACVQATGFDLRRLQTGVVYRDVEIPASASSYGLPAPLDEAL